MEISSFEPWLNQIDQVVISPGISWTHPTLNALRTHGVPVRGEMAFPECCGSNPPSQQHTLTVIHCCIKVLPIDMDRVMDRVRVDLTSIVSGDSLDRLANDLGVPEQQQPALRFKIKL